MSLKDANKSITGTKRLKVTEAPLRSNHILNVNSFMQRFLWIGNLPYVVMCRHPLTYSNKEENQQTGDFFPFLSLCKDEPHGLRIRYNLKMMR